MQPALRWYFRFKRSQKGDTLKIGYLDRQRNELI